MQTVAEHHLLRGKVDVTLSGFHVRIESNSTPLLRQLEAHFHDHVDHDRQDAQPSDLWIVALATSAVDLGLHYKPLQAAAPRASCSDEYADIDGGRVVHKVGTGVQFLLGPDVTMAVGPCDKHKELIIDLVDGAAP